MKNIKVKMVPVYPLGIKEGESESHWGVSFTHTGNEYLAMVDEDTANSLVEAGRAVVVPKPVEHEEQQPAKLGTQQPGMGPKRA